MVNINRSLAVMVVILFASLLLALVLLLITFPSARADSNIIYVNHAATGNNDGSSWDDAFTTLQAALSIATKTDEIWVATGVYTPTNTADQTASFQMGAGVALYGGFVATETERTDRNWETNPTILSGDLDGNDLTTPYGVVTDTAHIMGNNAYHVVTGNGVTETAILDGFAITAGHYGSYPDNSGSGMFNVSSSPSLANMTFSGNYAVYGGGMSNSENSHPTLTNVTFSNNAANDVGGGMYNVSSSPTLTNVTFSSNSVTYNGGGMMNNNSHPTLTSVTFYGNTAEDGAGMMNENSNPTLTNIIFSGNSASNRGGGMYNYQSYPLLTNVTFSGNSAGFRGGAIKNSYGDPKLVNCVLWGDNAPNGPEIYNYASTPSISYSNVQGGYAGTGNINNDPLFIAPLGAELAPTISGNYRLGVNSPAIDMGNTFSVTAVTDLDGNPRMVGDDVDMGAYEYQAFTLVINQVGEGEVIKSPDWLTYNYLDQVVLTATAESGWTFGGWYGDVTSTEEQITHTIIGNTIITATFVSEVEPQYFIFLPLEVRN